MPIAPNAQLPQRPRPPLDNRLKRFALKAHLYLGVGAGIFLLILGLTGTVIAFEQEIPRWANPQLYFVQPGVQKLPQQNLVNAVDRAFAPDSVRAVTVSRSAGRSELMTIAPPGGPSLSDPPLRAFINPYTGVVLGSLPMHTRIEDFVQTLHSLHLRLSEGKPGQWIMSITGLILCFEVIFGLIIWLKLKRAKIKVKGSSSFRKIFDLHHALGIYILVLLLLMGVTGTIIGFEDFFAANWIYGITQSAPLPPPKPLRSTPVPGAPPIRVDQAIALGEQALPGTSLTTVQMPAGPRGAYVIHLRYPHETAPAAMSTVGIDQYSGAVLQVRDLKHSEGMTVIRWIRSVHTGDLYGLTGHILVSLFSLALVLMVLSGVVIWWKKLAI